jgi:hypothetical protein
MKTLTRMAAAIATTAFILGTVACGGAADKAEDASDASGDDAAPKKSLEKFEGNRMEAAEEDE